MNVIEKYRKLTVMYTSGLLAISLAIFQGFVTTHPSDTSSAIAILCFAIAIPCQGSTLVANFVLEDNRGLPSIPWYLGIVTAFLGVAATFWHIAPLAGIIFFITSFIVSGTIARLTLDDIIEKFRTFK